jgi:RTX calcium-binding nonapeptide repeat (4 copies)
LNGSKHLLRLRRVGHGRLLVAFVAALAAAVMAPATASAELSPDAAAVAKGDARCADPCFLIGVTKVGTGTVTSNPAGIDCGQFCTADFISAPNVWLTATGGTIYGWHVTGGDEACAAIDGNKCLLESNGAITGYCVVVLFENVAPPPCNPPPAPSSPPPPPPADTNPPPLGSPCTIRGSNGPDVVNGTPGDDVICGLGGNDTIYGGGGHDLLVGGKGNDKLYGRAGNDRLVGGPGKDVLNGGAGADTFHARDRVRDVVNGGPGRDRARVDWLDAVRSIERRF